MANSLVGMSLLVFKPMAVCNVGELAGILGVLMEITRLEQVVKLTGAAKLDGMVVDVIAISGWKRVVQLIGNLGGSMMVFPANGTLEPESGGRPPPLGLWHGVFAENGQAALAPQRPLPLRSAFRRSAFLSRCTGSWRTRWASTFRASATSSLPPSWYSCLVSRGFARRETTATGRATPGRRVRPYTAPCQWA